RSREGREDPDDVLRDIERELGPRLSYPCAEFIDGGVPSAPRELTGVVDEDHVVPGRVLEYAPQLLRDRALLHAAGGPRAGVVAVEPEKGATGEPLHELGQFDARIPLDELDRARTAEPVLVLPEQNRVELDGVGAPEVLPGEIHHVAPVRAGLDED